MTLINKSKNSTKIIFTGIACFSLLPIYFFFFASRIQLEIYNNSDFDIDSLVVDKKYYSIPKNKSLVINCRRLTVQDGLPFGTPKGKIKNMRQEDSVLILCGTGVEEISSGKYQFDLDVSTTGNSYALLWKKHTAEKKLLQTDKNK